ncbi:MAG: carbohydrate ABC transporter permease [Eubacteriales bacterium]|nr:carbohydrate ABC transporter permease [Eubacteriales bacterium]
MKSPELKGRNRRALALLLLGLILALILMSLPLYSFNAAVYTKKSSNTFVGDEKYQSARAEVEEKAEGFRAQGFDVEINETVTERVNSKGETTSLIAFTIDQKLSRSLFAFWRTALPAGHVFRAMLLCALGSALCAALGLRGSEELLPKYLDGRSRVLRSAAGVLALIALLLVPVFVMMNNYAFGRALGLYSQELLTEGKEALYQRVDRFLFDGGAGENIDAALKGLSVRHSGMLWLLLPAFALMLLCAVQIRHAAIESTLLRGLLYVFVTVMCVVVLYPYYVMLVTAFRSNAETLDMYFLHMFPTKWIWSNLSDIVHRGVPRYLLNSVFVAGGATLLAMLCGIPAAYAMARMNFAGKKAFLGFVIMSQMFSPVVLLIGISQLMNTLHLNDSVVGLMLVNAAFNQAFAVWLLRGTFVSISPEMEQAALIDGCGTVSALVRVLLPMAAPGIVTALIFVFINAWNEYTISTVLISTASNRPITVGITQFSSFNMIEWQYLFAASLLATIPVVILFMSIEKHLTAGLTSGGVKG